MVSYLVKKGHTNEDSLYEGFFSAISAGYYDTVHYLLATGINVSYQWAYTFSMDLELSTDYENITPLYQAVMYGQREIALLLLEYGADPAIVCKEYDVEYDWEYTEADEDEMELQLVRTLTSEQTPLDLAKEKSYNDLVELMLNPAECSVLDETVSTAIDMDLDKKDFNSLAKRLDGINDTRYCAKDRDLLRNACFQTASDYFNNENFSSAISLFRRGLRYSISNTHRICNPVILEAADPASWEREGESDSPGYSCAYNIARAYSRLGDEDNGFRWLAIAFTMNPDLKIAAETEDDLKALREKQEKFNALTG